RDRRGTTVAFAPAREPLSRSCPTPAANSVRPTARRVDVPGSPMAPTDEQATPLPPLELDGPWKEAPEHFLPPVLARRVRRVHRDIDWQKDHRSLDQELQKLLPGDSSGMKRVDRLVEVTRQSGDLALLHAEAQHQRETDFEHRMHVYHDRIEGSRDLPVVSIAILGDDDP